MRRYGTGYNGIFIMQPISSTNLRVLCRSGWWVPISCMRIRRINNRYDNIFLYVLSVILARKRANFRFRRGVAGPIGTRCSKRVGNTGPG